MLGQSNIHVGPRFGVGWEAGEVIVPAGRDGPNNVLVPDCPEQWTLIGPGLVPAYLWPMQEASGNLLDVANNPAGVLVPSTTNVLMAQTFAGWARKAFRITAEGTGYGAHALVDQLWNAGNQSLVLFGYYAIRSSGGNRCLFLAGGASAGSLQVQVNSAGNLAPFVGGATFGTFVYESATPTAYPVFFEIDRRGAGAAALTTNKERVTRAYVNQSDNSKGMLGGPGQSAAISDCLLAGAFVGYGAEAVIDYGVKNIIAALGWPMAF